VLTTARFPLSTGSPQHARSRYYYYCISCRSTDATHESFTFLLHCKLLLYTTTTIIFATTGFPRLGLHQSSSRTFVSVTHALTHSQSPLTSSVSKLPFSAFPFLLPSDHRRLLSSLLSPTYTLQPRLLFLYFLQVCII
jgi:hypothetical protein